MAASRVDDDNTESNMASYPDAIKVSESFSLPFCFTYVPSIIFVMVATTMIIIVIIEYSGVIGCIIFSTDSLSATRPAL